MKISSKHLMWKEKVVLKKFVTYLFHIRFPEAAIVQYTALI